MVGAADVGDADPPGLPIRSTSFAQMAIASCVDKLRKLVVRVVEIGGMWCCELQHCMTALASIPWPSARL